MLVGASEDWYAAVCLASEAGLRIGEVKALRLREDVDMLARTIALEPRTLELVLRHRQY